MWRGFPKTLATAAAAAAAAAVERMMDREAVVTAKHAADNLAGLVEGLCAGMYRCVQDELLPLLVELVNIASYHPDGPTKAEEFPVTGV
uniref:Ariadne domain-containing protein n=1 Tax=Leersia perrieri TaxID=77586 RepID=A0A0D9VWI3_9ORYZ